MDREVIDLIKIIILIEEMNYGAELVIFSDIDIPPVRLCEEFQRPSYGKVTLNLLAETGFLVASELTSAGKIIGDNKFIVVQKKATCSGDISGQEKLRFWFEASAQLAISGEGNAFRCMESCLSKLITKTKATSLTYISSEKSIKSSLPLINVGEISTRKA